jgi:hypothetical protein
VLPLRGKPKHLAAARRNDDQGTCIPPRVVPDDTVGFTLVGPNERCLEAELTPLRRIMQEGLSTAS